MASHIQVAAPRPHEGIESHPRPGGHRHRYAGGGAYRDHRRNGGFEGFLDELESGPPADHEDPITQWELVPQEEVADRT